jgi:branched-chain amino acid transport system substrate-binding protein
MRRPGVAAVVAAGVALSAVAVACGRGGPGERGPIEIGAVYPVTGPDAAGGRDELRGVRLATAMVNAAGGVRGREVRLVAVDTPGPDAVPGALAELRSRGVRVVLGSNGSSVSAAAGDLAARTGMLFWETGAVGEMAERAPGAGGRAMFRVAPSGLVLGSAGISFVVDQMAGRLHRSPSSLRFAVVNVDDLYGRTVARGALGEIARRHLRLVGTFHYPVQGPDLRAVARRVAAVHPDVLFVSSYIPDGVALNRELVHARVPLLANIGTSSSYCMPEFGDALGRLAVGTFATDKPDGDSLNERGLTPGGRALLHAAEHAFRARFGGSMDAAALAGFSAAWALLHDVLPGATDVSPAAVSRAALGVHLPMGSLPNGSGVRFSGPGSPEPGSNLRALSVIWEWVGVRHRAVVWPLRYATTPIRALPLAA